MTRRRRRAVVAVPHGAARRRLEGSDPVIKTYRKLPVEIQAAQWTGGAEAAGPIVDWILTGQHTASWTEAHDGGPDYPAEPECIRINTLEGVMRATPGNWIIRGVHGEFYPCADEIFTATYEPCEAA